MDEYEPEYEPEEVRLTSPTLTSPLVLSVMTVLPPPVEYMSLLHDNKVEISSRKVWAGSLLLGEHLLTNPPPPVSTCIELGAGTGIVGITLAKANLTTITVLTDGDDEAITLLNANLEMNELSSDPSVTLTPYLWGNDATHLQKLTSFCKSSYPSTNWGATATFDLVVAGDVMYKSDLPALFFESVQNLLKQSGALYLCHVPRADVTHEVVVAAAIAHGFEIERVDEFDFQGERGYPTTLPDGCPMEDAERARIYKVTRPETLPPPPPALAFPCAFTTDRTTAKRTLGMILLQADESLEEDVKILFPATTTRTHYTRVPSDLEVTTSTLMKMKDHIGSAARRFPVAAHFDTVAYCCTSASSVIGEAKVEAIIREGA